MGGNIDLTGDIDFTDEIEIVDGAITIFKGKKIDREVTLYNLKVNSTVAIMVEQLTV